MVVNRGGQRGDEHRRTVRAGLARLIVEADNCILIGDIKAISSQRQPVGSVEVLREDSSTRSEEHTSELQSLMRISYAVFCLKKKKLIKNHKKTLITKTSQQHHV